MYIGVIMCAQEGGRARTLPVHSTYRPRFAGLELPRQAFMDIANTTFAKFRFEDNFSGLHFALPQILC